MSSETIEQLRAEALALDAEAQPAPTPEAPAPDAPAPVDLAAEIGGLMTAISAIMTPAFPSLATIYTETSIATAAASIAAVCNKHGWMQGGMMGDWGEEITCAVVCLPLAIATVNGVRGDMAKREEAEKPKREAATLAAGVNLTASAPETAPPSPATLTAGTVVLGPQT